MIRYRHIDGRYGLAASPKLADFTIADPGWHPVPLDEVRLAPSLLQSVDDDHSYYTEKNRRNTADLDELISLWGRAWGWLRALWR